MTSRESGRYLDFLYPWSTGSCLLLVIHCWVTNYPKTERFKPTFVISQFCGSEICMQFSCVLCFSVLQSRCWVWLKLSQGSAGERSTTKFMHVLVGRILFLAGCWPKAIFSSLSHESLQGSSQPCSLLDQGKRVRARERIQTRYVSVFYNMVSKVT